MHRHKLKIPTNPNYDPDWSIVTGSAGDQTFVEDLQRRFSADVGFVPRSAIAQRLEQGHYHVLSLRGQRAAFLYTLGGKQKSIRIVQHAVTEELWLQGYGRILASIAAFETRRARIPGIRLSVRDGMVAEKFWAALGAVPVGFRLGGLTKRKMLIDYEIPPDRVRDLIADVTTSADSLDPRIHIRSDNNQPLLQEIDPCFVKSF